MFFTFTFLQNESLVHQLSGKVMMRDTISSSRKTKAPTPSSQPSSTSRKKSSVQLSGKPELLSSTAKKALNGGIVRSGGDIEQLKAMHKMYANIARSITKGSTSLKSSPHGGSGSGTGGTTSRSSSVTRFSRKKALKKQQQQQFDNADEASLRLFAESAKGGGEDRGRREKEGGEWSEGERESAVPRRRRHSFSASADVRVPKPMTMGSLDDSSAMNLDYDEYLRRETARERHQIQSHHEQRSFQSIPPPPPSSSSSALHTSFPSSSSAAPMDGGRSAGEGQELQAVIASLEEEFESLNSQYRRLLNSAQQQGSDSSSSSSSNLIHSQADEIVSVIQKLHQKGEQLRALKNPIR